MIDPRLPGTEVPRSPRSGRAGSGGLLRPAALQRLEGALADQGPRHRRGHRWPQIGGGETEPGDFLPGRRGSVGRRSAPQPIPRTASESERIAGMGSSPSKLGFNATWSMAVGGMVGGGIFSTLGVVIGHRRRLGLAQLRRRRAHRAGRRLQLRQAGRSLRRGGRRLHLPARDRRRRASPAASRGCSSSATCSPTRSTPSPSGSTSGHVVGLGPWFPRVAARRHRGRCSSG